MSNEEVNKNVIRLHKELENASRTLGKVRRYGQPLAKSKLITACRQRLVSIVSELVTLEQGYAQTSDSQDNRSIDPNSGSAGSEVAVGIGGQGLDEGGASQDRGQTSTGESYSI